MGTPGLRSQAEPVPGDWCSAATSRLPRRVPCKLLGPVTRKPSDKAVPLLTGHRNEVLVSLSDPGALCGCWLLQSSGQVLSRHGPSSTLQPALHCSHIGDLPPRPAPPNPEPQQPAAVPSPAISRAPCLPVCSGPAWLSLGLSPAAQGPLPALPGLGRPILSLSLCSAQVPPRVASHCPALISHPVLPAEPQSLCGGWGGRPCEPQVG